MNKILKVLLLGVSLTVSVNTAIATNQYVDNSPYVEVNLTNVGQDGTDLMKEIRKGNFEAAKEEINTHSEMVGEQDQDGTTALMWTIYSINLTDDQKVELIKKLSEAEAGKKDKSGRTALMSASLFGETKCVAELIDKEAGIQDEYGLTALMAAAGEGHLECVKILKNKESGRKNMCGNTALISAATEGHLDCVKELMKEAGQQSNSGMTALIQAARYGHPDCVNVLKEKEASMKDKQNKTAMKWAIENNHPECAEVLKDKEEGI